MFPVAGKNLFSRVRARCSFQRLDAGFSIGVSCAIAVACAGAPAPSTAVAARAGAPEQEIAPSPVAPGCDSGRRAGFADGRRFPNIAACAGSWAAPGLDSTEQKKDGTAAALCAEGWHICTSVAEVKRKTDGVGCAAADLKGNVFFAIAEGAAGTSECFTGGGLGVLGCGTLGAPAPGLCAPMDRLSNPGCSALEEPWACEKNREVWSLVKPGQSGGGVLCCLGPAPQAQQLSEPWAFAKGAPFQGSGPSECGEVTLTTTNTEPWGDEAFRNVPGAPPAVVVVTFAKPIASFYVKVKLSGAKAYVTGFNVPPTRVAGPVVFDGKQVQLPNDTDEGVAVLGWVGLRADAISWVVGGKDRATVLSDGYALECE